ncbi:unnamed protein product [Prunus brigantina]
MAVQEHKQMEGPWRTHGWLTSHARVGCISVNVENIGYSYMVLLCNSAVGMSTRTSPLSVGENVTDRTYECYRDSEVGSAVGHVHEDVDTISGGECHGSHINRCYRDSVGTSMCLRGSPSVERART